MSEQKLHYDKKKLHKEYEKTYGVAMQATGILIAMAVIYFFIFVVYLGGRGHEPYQPFVDQFKDRFEIEYDGLRVPDVQLEKDHH